MKLTLLFFLILSYQVNSLATTYNGFIVTLKEDTIECILIFNDEQTFRFEDEFLMRSGLKAEVNGEIVKFKANEILSYSVKLREVLKTYYSVRTEEGVYSFMKKETEGRVNLYSGITYSEAIKKPNYYTLLIRNLTGEQLYVRVGDPANLQHLFQYFRDCKEIEAKISSKEFHTGKISHWKLIADYFNENCS